MTKFQVTLQPYIQDIAYLREIRLQGFQKNNRAEKVSRYRGFIMKDIFSYFCDIISQPQY